MTYYNNYDTGSKMSNNCVANEKGYFDVPICNEYSNKEIRDYPKETSDYQLNRDIQLTMNDNRQNYIVYQDPTVPSPSLFLETDQSMSGYYHKNPLSLAFDGTVPIPKKKDSKVYNYINSDLYPPFGIENFESEQKNKMQIHFVLLAIILLIVIWFFFK
jgi:hypothetical protein